MLLYIFTYFSLLSHIPSFQNAMTNNVHPEYDCIAIFLSSIEKKTEDIFFFIQTKLLQLGRELHCCGVGSVEACTVGSVVGLKVGKT